MRSADTRMWDLTRLRIGVSKDSIFEVEHDIKEWEQLLYNFTRSFESIDPQGVIQHLQNMIQIMNRYIEYGQIPPVIIELTIQSQLAPKLLQIFESGDVSILSIGIKTFAFLTMLSQEIVEYLFQNGCYEIFMNQLRQGNSVDLIFHVFATSSKNQNVYDNYRQELLVIAEMALRETTDENIWYHACYCAREYAWGVVDEGFMESLLASFRRITTAKLFTSNGNDEQLIEFIYDTIKMLCECEGIPSVLIRCEYPSLLLAQIQFLSSESALSCIKIIRLCVAEADVDELNECIISYLTPEVVQYLLQGNNELFGTVCELLADLVRKLSGFTRAIISDIGIADLIVTKIPELSFEDRASISGLINAIVQVEMSDEVLMPFLHPVIIDLLVELYELEEVDETGSYGTLSRFHAMTFEIPEIHEMLSEIVESSWD